MKMLFCDHFLVIALFLSTQIPTLVMLDSNNTDLGACMSQPCVHGVCLTTISGGYRCYCKNGFTGLECQTNYDDCRSNPCQNEASCVDGIESFLCFCPEGFTGELCETDINECQSNPCENNGICEDLSNGYICNCGPGYDGINCEEFVNSCAVKRETPLCQNGGTCVVGQKDTYSCSCPLEYYGDNCELPTCPCIRGGICIRGSDVTCLCPFAIPKNADCDARGWTGKTCETAVEVCDVNICQNDGLCILETFSGESYNISYNLTCFCVPDYHGTYCEERYDECVPDPICSNGATCVDGIDTYSCTCSEGFFGVNCEEIINCFNSTCVSENDESTYLFSDITAFTQTNAFVGVISSPSKFSNKMGFSIQSLSSSSLSSSMSHIEMSFTSSHTFPAVLSLDSDYLITESAPFLLSFTNGDATLIDSSVQHISLWSSSVYDLSQSESMILPSSVTKDFYYNNISNYERFNPTTFSIMDADSEDSDSYFLHSSFNSDIVSFTSNSYNEGKGIFVDFSASGSYILSKPNVFLPLDQTVYTFVNEGRQDGISTSDTVDSLEFLSPHSPLCYSNCPLTDYEMKSTAIESIPPYPTNFEIEIFSIIPSTVSVPKSSNSNVDFSTSSKYISASSTLYNLPISSPDNTTGDRLPNNCAQYICENGGTPLANDGIQKEAEEFSCECICNLLFVGRHCENEIYLLIPQFHGHSYLHHTLPSLEPQKGLEIDISFKTSSPHGIILFTEATSAGSFLLLYIDNGMLKFSFSCGHQTTVFMETHAAIKDSYFTSVSFVVTWTPDIAHVKNASCNVGLLVNGSAPMSGQQFVVNPSFDFQDLYIGGVPLDFDSSILEVHEIPNLTGCILGLQVNGKEMKLIHDAKDGTAITECYSSVCYHAPCQNGATCRSYEDHWNCECPEGFTGPLCEHQACFVNPCEYGGTCLPDSSVGYTCLCPFGKHGKNCENVQLITQPSFFGNIMGYTSFIQYTQRMAYDYHMEIKLRFIAVNMDQKSMLIFSGNTEALNAAVDFFAVGLESNYVVYSFNLGSGVRTLRSVGKLNHTVPVHTVLIGRHRRYGWLKVDDQRKVMGLASGTLTALNTESTIYIGGHYSFNFALLPPEIQSWKGFQGCIFDIQMRTTPGATFTDIGQMVSGRNIQQCNVSECQLVQCRNGGTCIDMGSSFQCHCPDGWAGTLCGDIETPCSKGNHHCSPSSLCVALDQGYRCDCLWGTGGQFCEESIIVSDPSFNGLNSFLSTSPMNVRHGMDIKIRFKPFSENGLIFYTAQHLHQLTHDFASLTISKGHLEYRFNLGSGPGTTLTLRTDRKVLNNSWQTVDFGRYKRVGYLKLNGEEISGVSIPGMEILDASTDFFLGGLPDLSFVAREAVEELASYFQGCIQVFQINGRIFEINNEDVTDGRNVNDCDGTSCGFGTCKHGGTCIPYGKEFKCLCSEQYNGHACETSEKCWKHGCLNDGVCIPNFNVSYSCDCPFGWEGERCEIDADIIIPYFMGNSYIYYKDNSFDSMQNEVSLSFSTHVDDGLIMWNGYVYSEDGDYLGLGLKSGHLHVVWNLGWLSRNEIITNGIEHGNGLWHFVHIKRYDQVLTLIVDNKTYVSSITGDFHELNTKGDFFFGGFPREYDYKEETGGYFSLPFIGCMKDIYILGNEVILINETMGQNIQSCSMT